MTDDVTESVTSIFQEDHLVPLAVVGDAPWFFNSLDGGIYASPPCYRKVSTERFDRPFIIPGDDRVLDLSYGEGNLGVSEHLFDELRTRLVRSRSYSVTADFEGSYVVSDLIEVGGQRQVVFSSATSKIAQILHLHSSEVDRVALPIGSRVRGRMSSGRVVSQLADRWSITGDDAVRTGVGTIVCLAGDHFVVRHGTKSQPRFAIVDEHSSQTIEPPQPWMPVSVALGAGELWVVCLAADRGYGLWKGGEMQLLGGVTQAFAQGVRAPIFRVAGVASGTRWLVDGTVIQGVARRRPDVTVTPMTLEDLPCLRISAGPGAKQVMLSFHGGPDSHEWDDLRYGGAYRAIVDHGFDIVIVNYPGSVGFGERFQVLAWRDWESHVRQVGRSLNQYIVENGYDSVVVFGVSFGAWMGLQVARLVACRHVVAMAPILDLKGHLHDHAAGDSEFRSWAVERFGSNFVHAARGDDLCRRFAMDVDVILPAHDEVVSPAQTESIASGQQWDVIAVSGSHYPKTVSAAEERWRAMVAAVTRETTRK